NLVSDQCGGMALLKQLTGADFKVDVAQPAPAATSNVVPLETGLFFAQDLFELLQTATAQPSASPDPENLIDVGEPIKKIAEVGTRWEIEVQLKGGGTKHGFARGGLFKAQTIDPVVDLEGFAQMCLDAARLNGTSAHHLIALADLETQIRNVGAKTGATTGAGPFLISAASWAAATAGGVPVLAPVARFDPLKQPFVAGKIAADAAKVLQSGDQLPTSAQLYLATLVGADHAKRILAKPDVDFFTAIVAETDPATADALRQVRPWL